MAYQRIPKMSLLAQYDDLCRNTKVLTAGCEDEFKTFVENQLNCVRKWKKVNAENKKLQSRITHLETENGRLETKIKHLKNLLEDADSARRKVEFEKKCLERTIAAVRDVILSDGVVDNQTKEKLAFLNSSYKPSGSSAAHLHTIEESVGSLFSLSDIDQTDDDLENRRSSKRENRRSKGKRSSSENRTSLKKTKIDHAEEFHDKINKESDQQSTSETVSTSSDTPVVSELIKKIETAHLRQNTYDQKSDTDSTVGSTPVSRQSSITKRISKNHQFVTKTNINRAKCMACRQTTGYLKQILKCQSCGITFHPECKNLCSMLCFPITNTPTKGKTGKVSDYTSSSSPMIPPLIVHCVKEIEARGMKEVGLYRVSASEREVKSLLEKFVSGHIIPCLSEVDIHALCVAVKEFLRSLSEPLITHKSWQDFVDAANLKDEQQRTWLLYGLASRLPQPNRDTLSFLILHWRKIAESPHCKMDIENLSKILGPTVVGYSTSDVTRADIFKETTYQHQVMRGLLSISTESWQSLLSVEMFQTVEKTPEKLPAPKASRLGPIYGSVQKRKSLTLRKTPLTPRNSKSNTKPGRMHFASPLLK